MSKELIENLRKDGKFLGGNFGKLMQEAADALEAKAAPVGVPVYQLQCREIGEGDWCPADLRHYTYCQRAPEMDTRIVEVQQAGAAYQRQSGVVIPHDLLIRVLEPVTSEQYINSKHELLALMREFAHLNGAGSHE